MASKGQKFNSYSPELKQEVLNKYFSGNGSRISLGREYNISHKIIYITVWSSYNTHKERIDW